MTPSISTLEDKLKANDLRKKGDIKAALPLYESLWESSKDKFAAAGLINCYRKMKMFDKAIPLAAEAFSKFSDFDWCRNEYIWTLIQGRLYSLPEDTQLEVAIPIAEQILAAKPDEIALKVAIFRILKIAKKRGNWEIMNEWLAKISPEILTGYEDESSDWTDRELWYYYKVNALINLNSNEEAIKLVEEKSSEFFKKKKFFRRLMAKAFINLNQLDRAEVTYTELTRSTGDWWLVHEHGVLLLKLNRTEEALSFFLKAYLMPPSKPELKVSLCKDIANILAERSDKKGAHAFYSLSKAVRLEQGWGSGDLDDKITSVSSENNQEPQPDVKTLLRECKSICQNLLHVDGKDDTPNGKQVGKIVSLFEEKPFCFIKTKDNQSFFCSKKDLPPNVGNDSLVKFDIVESFDKKKNLKSFKAIKISRV